MKKQILILSLILGALATLYANENVEVMNMPAKSVPVTPFAGWTLVKSTAKEASHVISAAPATLVWMIVSSDADQWILIIDSATVPGDGAVTLLAPPIHVGANTTTMIVFPSPLAAINGIAVCDSNANSFTKTVGGATCIYAAQYHL